ncbi:MAG: shikimate dehydrogenase [Chloroflexota bacterium]
MAINGQTQLVGVIGWPITHSLSPEMHNAAFSYMGLNWRYVPLPVRSEHLREALRGIASLGFRGINVTVPHKVDVIPLVDTITEAVTVVGAINTIRVDRSTGRLEGMNTDMGGFLSDMAANRISFGKDRPVIILGAGGAARAAAAGLVRSGAHVILVNRTLAHAESIVYFMQSSWAQPNIEFAPVDALAEVSRNACLIVNTTPVGQWPNVTETPWTEGVPFPQDCTVYDMVYHPVKTRLLREAEAAGLRAVSGIGMLVYQGANAFEAWTGKKPPIDLMKMTCLQILNESGALKL